MDTDIVMTAADLARMLATVAIVAGLVGFAIGVTP